MTHLNLNQKAPNHSLKLEKTRSPWKKLTESEKKKKLYKIPLSVPVSIDVPKNAPSKWTNDQLPSQISKTHRQYLCLPKILSYWPYGFYEELKERYSLHSISQILWQSVTKIIDTHYIFMGKSWKNVRFAQRYLISLSSWSNVVPSLEKLWQ